MNNHEPRDYVGVTDNEGNQKQYAIEALFDMDDESYALLESDTETILMRVENSEEGQYLVGITDPEELDAILSAYQIAVEAAAEDEQ